MPTASTRSLKIRIADGKLDLPERNTRAPINQNVDSEVDENRRKLEVLEARRLQLEQEAVELEEINRRKRDFFSGQLDVTEKLSRTVTAIEREVFEMKQEIQDMEQTATSFSAHLKRIQNINPEAWSQKKLGEELEKAITSVERAEDEYEQAADYFSGNRAGGIFGSGRNGSRGGASQEFADQIRNGLAFNLPVIILGVIALLAYLAKS